MVNYWDKYTEMHGQQNVKICDDSVCLLQIKNSIAFMKVSIWELRVLGHYIFARGAI